jgi:hypothetical protein
MGGGVVRAHVDGQHLLLGLQPAGLDQLALDLGPGVDQRRGRVLGEPVDAALGDRGLLVSEGLVSHHSNQRGASISLWVKRTGSPPIGKSRRCGQPT